jgi:hypothetical protein
VSTRYGLGQWFFGDGEGGTSTCAARGLTRVPSGCVPRRRRRSLLCAPMIVSSGSCVRSLVPAHLGGWDREQRLAAAFRGLDESEQSEKKKKIVSRAVTAHPMFGSAFCCGDARSSFWARHLGPEVACAHITDSLPSDFFLPRSSAQMRVACIALCAGVAAGTRFRHVPNSLHVPSLQWTSALQLSIGHACASCRLSPTSVG